MTPKSSQPVHWKPHPGPQTRALMAGDFEVLLGGARGVGKTDGLLAAITWPFKYRPKLLPLYRALVVRKNAKDLGNWLDRAARFYKNIGGSVVGTEVRFTSGAKIITGHMKDVNAYTQYIGHEYQFMGIEELSLIPREIDYLKLIGSCRSTVEGLHPQVFSTTNPGEAGHVWIANRWRIIGKPPYDDIRTTAAKGNRTRVFIPGTVKDNPTILKFDPEYYNFLDGLHEPLRSAWFLGDWSVFAGQFFQKLTPTIHAVMPVEIPERWPLTAGLDYGETAPTAFGLYTNDGTKTIRIGEYYVKDLSATEHARNIRDFCENNKWTGGRMPDVVYADPSMWTKKRLDEHSVESPADKFKAQGLRLTPANHDRINGWRACRDAIDWYKTDDGEWIREPKFVYFEGENPMFELYVPTAQTSKTNPEDIIKCDTDHIDDEWRYHMIAVRPKIVLKTSTPEFDEELAPLTAGIREERF